MLPIFFVCYIVVVGGFCLCFFSYQFLLQGVNDMQWKSIILGYCKYDFPLLLFILFCDWWC
jgi:hypothetical protein